MKNKEYYNLRDFDFSYREKKGMIVGSKGSIVTVLPETTVCDYFYELAEWLEQEYVEPIKLTDDEVVILKSIDKTYKWVARDSSKVLYVYKDRPTKDKDKYRWCGYNLADINAFTHLFQFVNWDDEEPYNIDELLGPYGVTRKEPEA